MKKLLLIISFCVPMAMTANSVAGDANAGKIKSEGCVGCHGLNGKSNNPNYPNLAGQKKNYLVKSIKDYRDGKRQDAMMSSMVSTLTDEDIENLAAYYSSAE